MSEIRYNRLYDTNVIIAPERLHRPDYGINNKCKLKGGVCPFCEGNESMTPSEIFAIREEGTFANEKGWKTRVIPNLYKALQIETAHKHHYSLFEYWDGFGAHEIIIDTAKHHISMTDWNQIEMINWLKTLRARVADLKRDTRIAYISLFKNEGIQAGSSQAHCHTQLIGLPIVPKLNRDIYYRSYTHFKNSGKALLETILQEEEEDGKRIVAKYADFTAFCPFASSFPFEVMISSQKDLGQIDTLSDSSMENLSKLLIGVIEKLKQQLGYFDFNLSVITSPLQDVVSEACRFAIRIIPRIYREGGFELSTGVFINPVAPEQAARLLRGSENE